MSSSAKVSPSIGGGKGAPTVEKKKRPVSNLKDLENGPNATRSCTDMICLIIYILFILLSIYITAVAFNKGNPWKLAQPFDIDGNACGAKGYPTEVGWYDVELPVCLLLQPHYRCPRGSHLRQGLS
jgi:hypothetical protein